MTDSVKINQIAVACAFFVLLQLQAFAAEGPVARWKLMGDTKNSVPSSPDGVNHGVKLAAKQATFDGLGSHITVPANDVLKLGKEDFTISVWVDSNGITDDDQGDILSQFDPKTRTGFHLSLRSNSGVTHCQPNERQLQFGIDAGTEPLLTDEGRPGNCVFGQSMAVNEGTLYVGTCEPGSDQAGHVYRYDGPNNWIDLGTPDKANSITSMAAFHGDLYVGSGKYRLGGSKLSESENQHLGGRIFQWGDSQWKMIGHFPEMEAVGGMVGFRGKLYVSSLYKPAAFFRYDGDGKWTPLEVPNGKRVEALGVFNDYLWATGYDEGHVYRYDGTEWTDLGNVGEKENTQTYAFSTYQGALQVATWRTGKVFAWQAPTPAAAKDVLGGHWQDRGRLGEELEVMGMLVHNGSLYAGTLPLAQMYRYDGGETWTPIKQLDTTDVEYRRVWTMAQHQGKLFATTLPSGHVWSLQTGTVVTWDQWKQVANHDRFHLVAQRHGDTLRLFVGGKMVAESKTAKTSELDLSTDHPWQIGAGSGDFFHGSLADVQIFRRALTAEEIRVLGQATRD